MTRWLTPALAFGVAASEANTGNLLWKSPTRLSLSQGADDLGYNPSNIVLDYMGQCTGVSIDKESCLISTTLAALMSSHSQSDGCNPPSVPEEDLFIVLNDRKAKCSASGQYTSDEEFDTAKSIFESTLTDAECFLQMCQEFIDPSPIFMEIVFDEAVRCAGVDLNVDDCISDSIRRIFSGAGDGEDPGPGRLLRSLQEDGPCSSSSVAELYAGATLMLQSAQDKCGAALSSNDFDTAAYELTTLLGSPQCFGQPPCSTEDDASTKDDDPSDTAWIEIGIKFVEQCAGLELDRNDCLVSTVMDIMASDHVMSNRRFLQEEASPCTAPSFEQDMLHDLLAGAREQCLYRSIEYSEDEYQQKADQMLQFFGAESCWIDLCEESMNPTESFVTPFIEQVADCAGAQLNIVNQCLINGVLDLLFFPGTENQTVIGIDITRRALRILSHNETENVDEPPSRCGPSEEELGPVVGFMLYTVEQNCTASGEQIEQVDLQTAYNELVKLLIAPPQCLGGSSEGCDEPLSKEPPAEHDDGGLNDFDVAIKYVEQCSHIVLDRDDCLTWNAVDILASDQPLARRRFLQEDTSPCNGASPRVPEEILFQVFSSARLKCSYEYIEYNANEYEQRIDHIMAFFGSSCWIDLCEDSMDPSVTFMTIFMEEVAECADVESNAVNQCLWDSTFNILATRSVEGMSGNGPAMVQRMLSHDEFDSDSMCELPTETEISSLVTPVLMEAGLQCIEMGEDLEQADIDAAYTEIVKFAAASPKCYGVPSLEGCEEGGITNKKTQDEINAHFMDFVRQGLLGELLHCGDITMDSCVTVKSVELLVQKTQSLCDPPTINEYGLVQIADSARSWCIANGQMVHDDYYYEAIDNMMNLVSSPSCWEGSCQRDFKNDGYMAWMDTCANVDFKLFYANDGDFKTELEKCMANYILSAKAEEEENIACGLLQLGPNVCGADFYLGIEAFMACSENITFDEHPTPSPVPFSMSYAFEQEWNDFEWADTERSLAENIVVEIQPTKLEVSVETVVAVGPEDEYMDFLPHELSFSYSFDDVFEHSMSFDFDDDYMHGPRDDDDEPLSPHEELARDVCYFLERMQYNLVARKCIKPACEIRLEDAFVAESNMDGGDPSNHPSAGPTVSPSQKPVGDSNVGSSSPPTLSPSARPSMKPTAASTTLKPTTLTPTKAPTARPSMKPTAASTTLEPTTLTPTKAPTANPTKAKFGSVDVKFEAAVMLDGINVSDLDFTALVAVVDLLEKVFASMLPEGALVRLLKVGGVAVTRRMLRNLQGEIQGVEVEFEVIITETCEDAECSNFSVSIYNDVTSNLQQKVADGSLATAIQDEADAEGVSELANVTIKPDSLKASEPTVTIKKADPETDDGPTNDDSASPLLESTVALAAVIVGSLCIFGC